MFATEPDMKKCQALIMATEYNHHILFSGETSTAWRQVNLNSNSVPTLIILCDPRSHLVYYTNFTNGKTIFPHLKEVLNQYS